MRIVFMGTPDFAVSSLEALYESGHEIALVVSQPDRPKGRGYNLTPSAVKQYALEKGTEVITPASLKDEDVIAKLKSVNADLFVVTAYGRILSKEILDIPRLGCVNVHASLLPKWRGAAPINRAIMCGDKVGGVTIMYMDVGLDTGDIIIKKAIDIKDDWTAEEYHDALAECGKEALKEFIECAEKGDIPRQKQDDDLATYAAKIGNEDAYLTFDEDAIDVRNRIRGLSPFPGSFFFLNGKRFKVRNAVLSDGNGEVGTVISTDKGGIEIACKSGSVIITKLCPEGKGVCDAESYLRGNKIAIGTKVNER
ncbi:MAG: methionyl-tRNA formyltransferase [Ruminococcaceae bacterium]|nr:methionyl-tRNA formyltransferase [Oscillospiraceae bacterium]